VPPLTETQQFRCARDLLIECRSDYEQAHSRFEWPAFRRFNWAVDWFDHLATVAGDRRALVVADATGPREAVTFAQMSARSDRAASWWYRAGVRRGDRVLLAMDNVVGIWESVLAAMKLGAVVIPASPRLSEREFAERLSRGGARHVVCDTRTATRLDRIAEGTTSLVLSAPGDDVPPGWGSLADCGCELSGREFPVADTAPTDPLLAYFTSGTTSDPKLVRHNHGYPIGHLSTMYWIGLRPGDVHLNVAAPGWAKHLGSGLFAAWNAEATVVVHRQERFSAAATLDVMERLKVTTVCAPPTAWRMLIQEDLTRRSLALREAVSAGEPLEADVIEHVRRAVGVTVRDGYGQTETTHVIGHSPGASVKLGSMGRPMPGFDVVLCNVRTGRATTSGAMEVVVAPGQLGIMDGYDHGEGSTPADQAPRHRTGDLARRDEDGYLTYLGRLDDVFKASGYRISPLEVERVLLEHPAVAEVAVVPSPDALRKWVPKAYVALASGWEPDRDTAWSILLHARSSLGRYKRIRRLTFGELPKTVSGKVRRSELRLREGQRGDAPVRDEEIVEEWQDHEFETASRPS